MTGFGIIGYGAIGSLRAQALRRTPGAELRMVAEPVEERRHRAASELGVRTVADAETLVRNPEVDVVIVSTPPNVHRRHCEAALSAGKHVLCEKPLATTVEDCRAIVERAAMAGVTLGTGFNYRFYPAVRKARELIAAGRIGQVDRVSSFAGHPGGPEFTHPWVHDPSIMGGGALMDNGIHLADLTLHFLGGFERAYGFSSERIWNFPGSEDNGYVLMRTAAGQVGTLHASWTEWRGYHFEVDIYGSKGAIRLHYPPMMTTLWDRPEGTAKKGRRQIFLFPLMQVRERLRSYKWTLVESLVAEQLDFLQRVNSGEGVGATGADGLRAVELACSAYNAEARGAKADGR